VAPRTSAAPQDDTLADDDLALAAPSDHDDDDDDVIVPVRDRLPDMAPDAASQVRSKTRRVSFHKSVDRRRQPVADDCASLFFFFPHDRLRRALPDRAAALADSSIVASPNDASLDGSFIPADQTDGAEWSCLSGPLTPSQMGRMTPTRAGRLTRSVICSFPHRAMDSSLTRTVPERAIGTRQRTARVA
jgi:hypothetical protein